MKRLERGNPYHSHDAEQDNLYQFDFLSQGSSCNVYSLGDLSRIASDVLDVVGYRI